MSRLERWSRKKRGIEHESDDRPPAEPVEPQLEVETHAPESDGIDASSPAVDEQEAAAPPLPGSLDHTLPDPDALPAGSDFSAFMVPGVSAALRRRACVGSGPPVTTMCAMVWMITTPTTLNS